LICSVKINFLTPGKGKESKIDQDWMNVDDPGGEVHMQEEKRTSNLQAGCSLEFQWVSGSDRSLFESFAGHVGRKVFERLSKH